MSEQTAVRDVSRAGASSTKVLIWQLRTYASLLAWFFGVVVAIVALALAIIGSSVERVMMSGLQFGGYAVLWFPYAAALILTLTRLAPAVVNGYTRRVFVRGSVAAATITGVATALILVVLLLIERTLYEGLDWTWGGPGDGQPGPLAGGTWSYLWGLALLITATACSGVLTGAVYYRWHAGIATLLLPIVLACPVAISVLMQPGSQYRMMDVLSGPGELAAPLRAGICLVLIAATVLATHLILRNVSIARRGQS